MSRRLVIAGCVFVIVLAGGVAYEYVKRPPLRLERAGSSAVVHVETLADYPTTVRRIQVSEISSRRVVFEVVGASGTPQIHNFRLSIGDNPVDTADPQYGSYRVVEPVEKPSFIISPGVAYRIRVWGNGWWPNEREVRF